MTAPNTLNAYSALYACLQCGASSPEGKVWIDMKESSPGYGRCQFCRNGGNVDPRVEALRKIDITSPEMFVQFLKAFEDPTTPKELQDILAEKLTAWEHRVAGWTYTVINPRIVPDDFLLVDYQKLQDEIKRQLARDSRMPAIAGVRFTKR